jgi:hypothetical protein
MDAGLAAILPGAGGKETGEGCIWQIDSLFNRSRTGGSRANCGFLPVDDRSIRFWSIQE